MFWWCVGYDWWFFVYLVCLDFCVGVGVDDFDGVVGVVVGYS